MAGPMDFPNNPSVGDLFVNSIGVTYQWNGTAWVAYYDALAFGTLGDLLKQIRVLLQDTDSSDYRYPTDDIVANINMGMIEMYRLRPDIFLENDFKVPVFVKDELAVPIVIEQQWAPPLVYYAVGLTQLRDEEGNQDQRAVSFMTRFTTILMTVNA